MDRGHDFTDLYNALYKRFNRAPTEKEIHGFIFGTDQERVDIWNFGIPDKKEDS